MSISAFFVGQKLHILIEQLSFFKALHPFSEGSILKDAIQALFLQTHVTCLEKMKHCYSSFCRVSTFLLMSTLSLLNPFSCTICQIPGEETMFIPSKRHRSLYSIYIICMIYDIIPLYEIMLLRGIIMPFLNCVSHFQSQRWFYQGALHFCTLYSLHLSNKTPFALCLECICGMRQKSATKQLRTMQSPPTAPQTATRHRCTLPIWAFDSIRTVATSLPSLEVKGASHTSLASHHVKVRRV